MRNTVIYLNGPSSSGKTTIAHALQNSLEEPYLHVSIDSLINMMPEKVNDWTATKNVSGYSFIKQIDKDGAEKIILNVGTYAKKINPAFHAMVKALLESGLNLIIDDISYGKEQVALWHESLKEYNVLWVGVTADLEILESREKQRGDRLVGSAKDQAEHIHKGVKYDLLINTSEMTVENSVKTISQQISLKQ